MSTELRSSEPLVSGWLTSEPVPLDKPASPTFYIKQNSFSILLFPGIAYDEAVGLGTEWARPASVEITFLGCSPRSEQIRMESLEGKEAGESCQPWSASTTPLLESGNFGAHSTASHVNRL
ncbi:hypothetical protein DPX16_10540 [Anabarilius grahami]|uniref:Uncharacterized protein n=1 Tax=Anabarilius grahami TaxID=495550 RepID=A0A3N0Z6M8_ANAGA|nr:hypothetical protein DPX16_10540 [Anabarilius grahami]